MRYLVLISKCPNNYAAGAPDVLGCVSVADTLQEMEANIREALEFHFEGTQEDGDPIPEPTARAAVAEGYNVVIHREGGAWKAFVDELFPFMVAADAPERAESLMREVLPGYLADLRDNETPAPEPSSHVVYVDVTLPVPA
jgi:predicted RNase H-like HicB family nuclease